MGPRRGVRVRPPAHRLQVTPGWAGWPR